MKRKYCFPVSQQAILLGLEWKKICHYALGQPDLFEEALHWKNFVGGGDNAYHWAYSGCDASAARGRFLPYYLHEVVQPEGSIFEMYLKEGQFNSQLEEILAMRLAQAEVALVEFMGMHKDECRFYARDLSSGKEMLYSPNDYLEYWSLPTRPQKDGLFMQIYRVSLRTVGQQVPEAVILSTPTYFTGSELKARGLTSIRLSPTALSSFKLERKLWHRAHWMDFCVDMPIPSEGYLQALVRWEEYLQGDLESSESFRCFLHELEPSERLLQAVVSDLEGATVAIPELEWVLETLWNEQPRVPLWGKTPNQLNNHTCTQEMLNLLIDALRDSGKVNVLPGHVLMAKLLEPGFAPGPST